MPDNCSNSTAVDFTITNEDSDVPMGNHGTCDSQLTTGGLKSELHAKAEEVCYGIVPNLP